MPSGILEADRSAFPTTRQSIANRLKLIFAIQCCLGGLVLGSASGADFIPVVAIFFAIFGYVFVDVLALFSLPAFAAYALMGLVALNSVGQFWDNWHAADQTQMVAVGELLVFVQSILMLQHKTRRIFEQLVVFALLELIVAAVFNNAIYYGLLLVPMTLLAVWSLSLMAALETWEGVLERPAEDAGTSESIVSWSDSTTESFAASSLKFPRLTLMMLGPAVLVVGLIFFYALPRINQARRSDAGGRAVVGFSDELKLSQMGQMLQSPAPALRVTLTHQNTTRPYRAAHGIYLRGRVMERYAPPRPGSEQSASWSSSIHDTLPQAENLDLPWQAKSLPPEETISFDPVDVKLVCEPTDSESLFAIAPYFRKGTTSELKHELQTWTLRRSEPKRWRYPRVSYDFSTQAFFRGEQNRLLTQFSHPITDLLPDPHRKDMDPEVQRQRDLARIEVHQQEYLKDLLEIHVHAQPTAIATAKRIAQAIPSEERNPYRISLAMESYLRDHAPLSYSLNLTAKPIPGIDPVEQFLAVDRQGHCQYFASALALMLRSQDIPARLVAGYHTDEFNELGGYYTARQLHAHAWVEALLPAASLPDPDQVPGHDLAQNYWLRLDPTPIANRANRSDPGGVNQVMDLARNMWDEYVVEMDSKRQEKTLLGASGLTPISESYASLINSLQLQVSRIRHGELGGGALAGRELFSLPAALFAVLLAAVAVVLFRIKLPAWWRKRSGNPAARAVPIPSIPFFAETLQQLGRLGLRRRAAETPAEFTSATAADLSHPLHSSFERPLFTLTDAFYRYRFGRQSEATSNADVGLEPAIEQALAEIRAGVDRMTEGNRS